MHQGLLQAGKVDGTAPALVPSTQYSIPPLSQEPLPYLYATPTLFRLHRLKHSLHINSVIQLLTLPLPRMLFVS